MSNLFKSTAVTRVRVESSVVGGSVILAWSFSRKIKKKIFENLTTLARHGNQFLASSTTTQWTEKYPQGDFLHNFWENFEDSLAKANGCKMTQINPKSKKNEDEGWEIWYGMNVSNNLHIIRCRRSFNGINKKRTLFFSENRSDKRTKFDYYLYWYARYRIV